MASKKDFSGINTNSIYGDVIAEATAPERKERKTYDDKEAAELMQSLHTTGRKGVKLPRLNLALAPDMYDYVKTMSKITGMTYTEFLDKVLRAHKEAHGEAYAAAVKIRESI